MTNYESVTTHDLADGDIVKVYGCTFRLKDRKEWPIASNEDPVRQGACITFATDGLEYSPDCGFPQWWFDDWTVQGNKLATWARQVR